MDMLKGCEKALKYKRAVGQYLFFCDPQKVAWRWVGDSKQITKYVNFWLKYTPVQATTLLDHLKSIEFAANWANTHLNIQIDKMHATMFNLKKMLAEIGHGREQFLEEQLDSLPSYNEVAHFTS